MSICIYILIDICFANAHAVGGDGISHGGKGDLAFNEPLRKISPVREPEQLGFSIATVRKSQPELSFCESHELLYHVMPGKP